MKPAKIRLRKVAAGHWTWSSDLHTYNVFRVRSEYGDDQWITDRDDQAGWAQTDTLSGARATIARDHLAVKKSTAQLDAEIAEVLAKEQRPPVLRLLAKDKP